MSSPKSSCCSSSSDTEASPCSCSTVTPQLTEIRTTDSTITFANRLDHFLARWGIDRMGHRVEPGLYRLGNPTSESLVFASANYTLSFDALRSALAGNDAWILVLDTKGINVWCAAGKGTFGTDELVSRIETTGLASIVTDRKIIVPQLGAPGVSWPGVLRRSGFNVEYGPVRASDLPAYLKEHTATPEMRRVRFPLWDRIILIPVELVQALPITIISVLAAGFLLNWIIAAQLLTAILAGLVLFPALLPVLPTKDFSTKGLILGGIVMLPFIAAAGPAGAAGTSLNWGTYLISSLLIFPTVTAYLALNFTGCTPFTSRTGVRKEIFSYIRILAVMVIAGLIIAGAGWLVQAGVV